VFVATYLRFKTSGISSTLEQRVYVLAANAVNTVSAPAWEGARARARGGCAPGVVCRFIGSEDNHPLSA